MLEFYCGKKKTKQQETDEFSELEWKMYEVV